MTFIHFRLYERSLGNLSDILFAVKMLDATFLYAMIWLPKRKKKENAWMTKANVWHAEKTPASAVSQYYQSVALWLHRSKPLALVRRWWLQSGLSNHRSVSFPGTASAGTPLVWRRYGYVVGGACGACVSYPWRLRDTQRLNLEDKPEDLTVGPTSRWWGTHRWVARL